MRKNIVLDTNTILSSTLFPNSITFKAYEKAINHCQIVMSNATLAELELVITRPKFDRYLPLTTRLAFVEFLKNITLFIEPTETITDCRDPKDNKFLEIAVAAAAIFIVTGDNDLLVLNPYRGVEILKSSDFLAVELA